MGLVQHGLPSTGSEPRLAGLGLSRPGPLQRGVRGTPSWFRDVVIAWLILTPLRNARTSRRRLPAASLQRKAAQLHCGRRDHLAGPPHQSILWRIEVPLPPVPLCPPMLEMQVSSSTGRVWREGPPAASRSPCWRPAGPITGDRRLDVICRLTRLGYGHSHATRQS